MKLQHALLLLFVSWNFAALPAHADGNRLKSFLKACAWGTAIGAGAGAITLAFENRPEDHTVNIARGASLGLYAGIAYGLTQMSEPNAARPATSEAMALVPRWRDGRLDGASFETRVVEF